MIIHVDIPVSKFGEMPPMQDRVAALQNLREAGMRVNFQVDDVTQRYVEVQRHFGGTVYLFVMSAGDEARADLRGVKVLRQEFVSDDPPPPVFEIKAVDRHIKIWADGRVEGIEGVVINRLPQSGN